MMNLRTAKPDDFDFLIAGLEKNRVLERRSESDIPASAADRQEFHEAIAKQNVRIAEEAGEPIGFLYFRTDFKVMYLHAPFFWVDLIYVDEEQRGKGVGKRLYEDAIRIAREKGFTKVVIDIFTANQNSIGFHEKLGFRPLYTIYQKEI